MTDCEILVADGCEDWGDVSDHAEKRAKVRSDLAWWLCLIRADRRKARRDPQTFDQHAYAIAQEAVYRRRNLLRVMDTGLSNPDKWWLWHRNSKFNEPEFMQAVHAGLEWRRDMDG